MDIEDFVATTLVQIARGINTAKDQMGPTGHSVGSSTRNAIRGDIPGSLFQDNQGRFLSSVDFDIAVTATSETEGSGRLKIPYFEAGAGGSAGNEKVSRVKFTLPLLIRD